MPDVRHLVDHNTTEQWREGYEAYFDGVYDNPYIFRSLCWYRWEEGYMSASLDVGDKEQAEAIALKSGSFRFVHIYLQRVNENSC